MEKLYYEKQIPVLMRDCDMFRRLKPSVLLAMFQDCSEDLTEAWGVGLDAMLQRGAIWVAAKVSCAARRLPEHGETVTVRGWAGRSRGGICPFHYELLDAAGALCVTGCSLWVLADRETRSMMGPHVPKLALPTPEPEGTRLPRMEAITAPEHYADFARRVRYSEVDINGHLTNTRYVDWMSDLLAPDLHRDHPMTALRINYRAEIFPEEEPVLRWACDGERLWCRSDGRFEAMMKFS